MKVFLFLANFELDGMTSHKHDLAAKTRRLRKSLERNFFWITSTSEAETSERERTECILAKSEDKKVSFL